MATLYVDYRGSMTGIVDFPGPMFGRFASTASKNGIFVQVTFQGYTELDPEAPDLSASDLDVLRFSPYKIDGILMDSEFNKSADWFSLRPHADRGTFESWYAEGWLSGFCSEYAKQNAACFSYGIIKKPEEPQAPEEGFGSPEEQSEFDDAVVQYNLDLANYSAQSIYGGFVPQRGLARLFKDVADENDPLYGSHNPQQVSLETLYGGFDFGDWVPANPPGEIWVVDEERVVFDHFDLLIAHNTTRGDGLPLRRVAELDRAAQRHADWLVSTNRFQHEGKYGTTPQQRAQEAGYVGAAGENNAARVWSIQAAIDGWVASPGHFANLMNPNWVHFGCGYASGGAFGNVWVVLFGQPAPGYSATVLPIPEESWERKVYPFRVVVPFPMSSKPKVSKSGTVDIPIVIGDEFVAIQAPLPYDMMDYAFSITDVSPDGQKAIVLMTASPDFIGQSYGRPSRVMAGLFEINFKTISVTQLKTAEDMWVADETHAPKTVRAVYIPQITGGSGWTAEDWWDHDWYHYCRYQKPEDDPVQPGVPNTFCTVFGFVDRGKLAAERSITPVCNQSGVIVMPPVDWPVVQTFVGVDLSTSASPSWNNPSALEVTFDFSNATRVEIPDSYTGGAEGWLRDNYPNVGLAVSVTERRTGLSWDQVFQQVVSAQYDEDGSIRYVVSEFTLQETVPDIQQPPAQVSGTLVVGLEEQVIGDIWNHTFQNWAFLDGSWAARWVFVIKSSNVMVTQPAVNAAVWAGEGALSLGLHTDIGGDPILGPEDDPDFYKISSQLTLTSESLSDSIVTRINTHTGSEWFGRAGALGGVGSPVYFDQVTEAYQASYTSQIETTGDALPSFAETPPEDLSVAYYGPIVAEEDLSLAEELVDRESVDIWSAISYAFREPTSHSQWQSTMGRLLVGLGVDSKLRSGPSSYHDISGSGYWTYDSGPYNWLIHRKDNASTIPGFGTYFDTIDGRCWCVTTYVGYPEHGDAGVASRSTRHVSKVLTPLGVVGGPLNEEESKVDMYPAIWDDPPPNDMRKPWECLPCGTYHPIHGYVIREITAPVAWTGVSAEWAEEQPKVVIGDAQLFAKIGVPDWYGEQEP